MQFIATLTENRPIVVRQFVSGVLFLMPDQADLSRRVCTPLTVLTFGDSAIYAHAIYDQREVWHPIERFDTQLDH